MPGIVIPTSPFPFSPSHLGALGGLGGFIPASGPSASAGCPARTGVSVRAGAADVAGGDVRVIGEEAVDVRDFGRDADALLTGQFDK